MVDALDGGSVGPWIESVVAGREGAVLVLLVAVLVRLEGSVVGFLGGGMFTMVVDT